MNGDTVEYSRNGNVVVAEGNVIVVYKGTTLTADRIEFSRETNIAVAQGNVRLKTEQGELAGNAITFNYETMTGEFQNARVVAQPYFGGGEEVAKVSDNEINVKNGFITTCDHDKPHYSVTSKKIEVFPGDKFIARGSKLLLGNIPLLYVPKFTHSLKDTRPRVIFTPGYDSDWGAFLLSGWRYYINDDVKGVIHVDYREKLDLASGLDLDYKSQKVGKGLLRLYYTNERRITSDHPWEEKPSPTIERERYKIEWRHKWQIDDRTNAIMQYYQLSDATFLKDYFEREYEEDPTPETFFLLTRSMLKGTFSARTDVRINRFVGAVERLPELRYDLPSVEIGDTGLYFRNIATLSNLTKKTAAPSEVRQKTKRADLDYEVSYPRKVGFIEFRPFVGGQNTYYSRTKDPEKTDAVRGIFKTGASLSTKFYRIFDVEQDNFGFDIQRLRHIITPSVSYEYTTEPTIATSQLDQYDSIDSRDRHHSVNIGLENKLQTKRDGRTVELLRALVSTDYRLKEHPGDVGFDTVSTDIDFRPTDWLTLYFDSTYNTRKTRLDTANFDMYINGGKKWRLGLIHRYSHLVDDELITEFKYLINPKWAFRLLGRFNPDTGEFEEQEYTLTRDLHAWEMDININDDRIDQETEFVVIFRLKAFPEIGLDFGTTFDRRRSGSERE